jgi:hypothetical protein
MQWLDAIIGLLYGLTYVLLLVLVFGSPMLVAGILIWHWVRTTDSWKTRRGFEVNDVKTNTGGSPVADTERDTHNG